MARGTLRVYLGAAPGVGKTFAMLNEGIAAASAGTDVVVGYVETHGRARTAEQIGDLEVVPRQRIEYRARRSRRWTSTPSSPAARRSRSSTSSPTPTFPARATPSGGRTSNELLDAGIDVISTVNIQHLESINDVVERITGIVQRETIPDAIVRAADQVELVDMTPEALRRRMAHGNIYAPEKIDAALTNYFRPGTSPRSASSRCCGSPTRSTSRSRTTASATASPSRGRRASGSSSPSPARPAPRTSSGAPRASPSGPTASCSACTSAASDGLAGPGTELLAEHRQLLEELGGEYHEVAGSDVAAALVDFARARERDAARARAQPPQPLDTSSPGLGDQPGRSGSRGRSTCT